MDDIDAMCVEPVSKKVNENPSICVEPMLCRGIRIGSYKLFAPLNEDYISVRLTPESIFFLAHKWKEGNRWAQILITRIGIDKMYCYLGKSPVIFILPTPEFATQIRNSLDMDENCSFTLNPTEKDPRSAFITFLIHSLTEEQISLIQHFYISTNVARELTKQGKDTLLLRTAPTLSSTFLRLALSNENPADVLEENIPQPAPGEPEPEPALPQEHKLLSYHSKSQNGCVEVSNIDVMCLDNSNWLNDNIVNFYLEYLYSEILTDIQREKTHLFTSFLYSSLNRQLNNTGDTTNIKEIRHGLVKTWTSKVDLFSKDFIVFPVNDKSHWYLAIACFPINMSEISSIQKESEISSIQNESEMMPKEFETIMVKQDGDKIIKKRMGERENGGQCSPNKIEENSASSSTPVGLQGMKTPCICVFDSIYEPERAIETATIIRDYLEVEYKVKKGVNLSFEAMKIFPIKCPQQPNAYDCGIYLLKNFQFFFQKSLEQFDDPMPDLTNWFPEASIYLKRQDILRLILDCNQKYKSDT